MLRSLLVVLLLLLLLLPSCRTASAPAAPTLTVEGVVTMRGHEPFSVPVLETEHRALYVLDFEGEESSPLQTPRRYRVSGELYRDAWQGRPFAHLRVETWEEVRYDS